MSTSNTKTQEQQSSHTYILVTASYLKHTTSYDMKANMDRYT